MTSLVAGAVAAAALDLVFKGLFDAVKNAIKKNVAFKDTMKKVRETLNNMKPKIMEIAKLDTLFGRPSEIQGLIDLMKEGTELVKRCENANILKRAKYTRRLESLQARLASYVSFELQMQIAAVGREALSKAQQGAADAKKALEVAERHERVGGQILNQMSELKEICNQMSARLTNVETKMELVERTTSKMLSLSSGIGVLGANASPVSLNCGPSPPPQELELSPPISIANNAVSTIRGNKLDQPSKKSRKRSNRTYDTETETRSSKSQRRLFPEQQ